jgi:signal recognition particle subunit SRP54
MTRATLPERNRPDVLNGSRKRRISMGSGTSVAEINRLLKQYKQMQKMMKGVQGKWLHRAMGSGAGMQG